MTKVIKTAIGKTLKLKLVVPEMETNLSIFTTKGYKHAKSRNKLEGTNNSKV